MICARVKLELRPGPAWGFPLLTTPLQGGSSPLPHPNSLHWLLSTRDSPRANVTPSCHRHRGSTCRFIRLRTSVCPLFHNGSGFMCMCAGGRREGRREWQGSDLADREIATRFQWPACSQPSPDRRANWLLSYLQSNAAELTCPAPEAPPTRNHLFIYFLFTLDSPLRYAISFSKALVTNCTHPRAQQTLWWPAALVIFFSLFYLVQTVDVKEHVIDTCL